MKHMKHILFLLALPLLAQEAPKPPDSAIAAYFKADAAVGAAKAAHDALMEQIKKAIADSLQKQVDATVRAMIAGSQLQAACGDFQLDQTALQSGEVKCIEKPTK